MYLDVTTGQPILEGQGRRGRSRAWLTAKTVYHLRHHELYVLGTWTRKRKDIEGHKRSQQERERDIKESASLTNVVSEETSVKRSFASSGNVLLKEHLHHQEICFWRQMSEKDISVIRKCTFKETSAKRASTSSDTFLNPLAASPGIEHGNSTQDSLQL